MDFNQYSALAQRTVNPEADNLVNAALGISGEGGEIADLVKKHRFQGHELDVPKLVKEIGDVLWYLALLSRELEIPFESIAAQNISKLQERYPEGHFRAERSVNRKAES